MRLQKPRRQERGASFTRGGPPSGISAGVVRGKWSQSMRGLSSEFFPECANKGVLSGRMRAAKNCFQHDVGAELTDVADSHGRKSLSGGAHERHVGNAGDFGGVEEDEVVDDVGREGGGVEVGAGFEEDA